MFNRWIEKKRHIVNEWIYSATKIFTSKCKSWIRSVLLCNKKTDLKNATGVGTSDFAKKTDLANLKSDVHKLDIDKVKNVPTDLSNLKSKVDKLEIGKLETTPVDLSKLSNVVKNDVVRKTEYNEFVKKVNNINTTDTSDLVKKNTIVSEIGNKINDHDHPKYIATQEFNN